MDYIKVGKKQKIVDGDLEVRGADFEEELLQKDQPIGKVGNGKIMKEELEEQEFSPSEELEEQEFSPSEELEKYIEELEEQEDKVNEKPVSNPYYFEKKVTNNYWKTILSNLSSLSMWGLVAFFVTSTYFVYTNKLGGDIWAMCNAVLFSIVLSTRVIWED